MRRFHETLCVRQNVLEAPQLLDDQGIMITVYKDGGAGYGATADLSAAGVKRAFDEALSRAEKSAKWALVRYDADHGSSARGSYASPVLSAWGNTSLASKIDLLKAASERLSRGDSRFVDCAAALHYRRWQVSLVNSRGARIEQTFDLLNPTLHAIVHQGGVTESRSLAGQAVCRQGGMEILDQISYLSAAERIHDEALELVAAPQCPAGSMDLLLAPDQMILQIHESIGHPLELDRILGDERNYAGTSFVSPEMFGNYRYGSELLNVVFDPHVPQEFASYAFDDDGQVAERTYLIKGGILLAGLGGRLSQLRLGVPGVANARSVSWNRPTIDRMANLNIEAGTSRWDDMIATVERGVYMETNCSWSIDDSRNKFQFGCEFARLIENGRLTSVVRRPNYRGISSTFWRNLKAVGDASTVDVLGTAYCGKGEPNQAITVGHASPACLFSGVEVFGGES